MNTVHFGKTFFHFFKMIYENRRSGTLSSRRFSSYFRFACNLCGSTAFKNDLYLAGKSPGYDKILFHFFW